MLGKKESAYLKAVSCLDQEMNIINIVRDLRWVKLSLNQLLSDKQRLLNQGFTKRLKINERVDTKVFS